MGWDAVWQLALKQFGAEPVEFRLAILLAGAFVFALVLVGLKHAFRSAEPKSSAPEPMAPPPKRIFAAPVAVTAAVEEPRQSAPARTPFKAVQPATRKSVKQSVNRQQAMRPAIRRGKLPSLAEIRQSSPVRPPKP